MRPFPSKTTHVLWMISVLAIVSLCCGCGGTDLKGDHVLASDSGITLTGPSNAVPPGAVLTVATLTEAEAGAKATLPADRVFVGAVDCGPVSTLLSPVRLNLTIPNKFLPGWRLTVYTLQGSTWVLAGKEAVVGTDGLTAQIDTRGLTAFLFCLDDHWKSLDSAGQTVEYREDGFASTSLDNPQILAVGTGADPQFMTKLCEVTGYTEPQAQSFLLSYDTTGANVVRIIQLSNSMVVCRNWGPAGKLGRWFAPTTSGHLDTPEQARTEYALPDANTATGCTYYRLKRRAILVAGICADMSQQPPVFGPDATGGGTQYFAPAATQWVVDHAEINPDTLELLAELRYPKF